MQLYLEFIKSTKNRNPKAMDIWQVLMTISVAQIKYKPDRLSPRHPNKNVLKAEFITLNHNFFCSLIK